MQDKVLTGKSEREAMVREFSIHYGFPISTVPNVASKATRALRVKLLIEEVLELASALKVSVEVGHTEEGDPAYEVTAYGDDSEVDLVEAADALGDIEYVTHGANLAFGLPADKVFAEIQRSNMTKLGADGLPVYRADGKLIKGPNWEPPKIEPILLDASAR